MFSSRRRPVLNLRPGADGWNFTPDTDLDAFLAHTGIGHDVIADEDVHAEGVAALAPYRVVVTGTHPEYWSTAMLDALADWQRGGGRLMYLGGNGFYWRVAFSEHWPGAMELRRAEDGVRNWQTGPGESYHAFGGEYGGLWRRLGRAPERARRDRLRRPGLRAGDALPRRRRRPHARGRRGSSTASTAT